MFGHKKTKAERARGVLGTYAKGKAIKKTAKGAGKAAKWTAIWKTAKNAPKAAWLALGAAGAAAFAAKKRSGSSGGTATA